MFSGDVTAAMLVSLIKKRTAAMLVSPTNPLGIELYSYVLKVFFCFALNMLIDQVSENTLYAAFRLVLARRCMQSVINLSVNSSLTLLPLTKMRLHYICELLF